MTRAVTKYRNIPKCPNGLRYGDGCRCDFCKKQVAAGQAAYRYREMQRERGIEFSLDLVDAAKSRRVVRLAQRRGIGYREMVRLTGITRATLQKIGNGRTKKVRRSTQDVILEELQIRENRAVLPGTMIDPTWTRQMIYSLQAQGWSKPHLQEILQKNLGVNGGFIYSLTTTPVAALTRERNRQHMLWLTDAIGDKQGPNKAVAGMMFHRGIFPVKHYDYQGKIMVRTLSPEQKAKYESV